MKKSILLFLPLIFLSLTAFAQLEKGNKILGGSFNYSITSDKSQAYGVIESSDYFQFSPSLGSFVKDNLALGLGLSYQNSESSVNDGFVVDNTNSSFGVGPYIQKYFPVGEKFSFFGRLGIGYNWGKNENSYDVDYMSDSKINYSSLNVNTLFGFSFFPKKWMSIDLSVCPLRYSHDVSKPEGSSDDNKYSSNAFSFSLDTSAILLGANFYLSKK